MLLFRFSLPPSLCSSTLLLLPLPALLLSLLLLPPTPPSLSDVIPVLNFSLCCLPPLWSISLSTHVVSSLTSPLLPPSHISILYHTSIFTTAFSLYPHPSLFCCMCPSSIPPPSPSSKYRPSSEQHNDNFSLSTIAEGSHPNVRKLCDTPPNVPHARALAYYDNIICQVTWFLPLSLSLSLLLTHCPPLVFFPAPSPPNLKQKYPPGPPHPALPACISLMHGHEYSPIL